MPDMSHSQGSEVIGIVDPPRAGLRESGSHSMGLYITYHVFPLDPKVVETIRKCAPLRRLVYVSCHLEGARKNLLKYAHTHTLHTHAHTHTHTHIHTHLSIHSRSTLPSHDLSYLMMILSCWLFVFLSLCRRASNRIKGLPFRPVSATPIDLFPHTPHCEVVFLLERVTQEDLKQTDKRVKDSSPPGVKDSSPSVETDMIY